MTRLLLRRAKDRVGLLARRSLLFGVVGLAAVTAPAVLTVEYTAQPQFCNTCHIMEPYYESWLASSHSDVSCIECHYEPGAVETVEGKLKALSQLAKYATRTEGTKPWAEVSDASCMRSGCHSVRMLEGPIAFGRVKFDHRHHLLESRRGRRLRCTSCHSQIVQGDHVAVTESVCFTCHFMPAGDEGPPAVTGDCLLCHGPPQEPVEVAGRDFDHREYVDRGVACQECHDPVIDGDGSVRRERCHSCHAEIGHIERYGETAFLHEMHVTEHKVECFECHDEIHHGLLPLEPLEPAEQEGCGSCHFDTHDANRMLYTGTGAVGVEDAPSRMYVTRVVCSACHTGRSGLVGDGGFAPPVPAGARHRTPHGATVAAAGSVDCIHCHGPRFDGMLERWQAVVGDELDRLRPLADELGELAAAGSSERVAELHAEATHNLELVEKDGSRGAHNPLYALAALRAGAERIEAAFALATPSREVEATAGAPFVSSHGCSECHLGVELGDPLEVHARPFSHGRHLEAAGLDCNACHRVEAHGAPAFPRQECASCHHAEEAETFDPWDCSACHGAQESFLVGELEGFEDLPAPMAAKTCDVCHGEPPDVLIPGARLCALCHDQEQGEALDARRNRTEELVADLRSELALARARGAPPESLAAARRALEVVLRDGSRGAHNFELAERLLEDALAGLR